MSHLNTCVSACILGHLMFYRAIIPQRYPMKLNRECSLQANIQWSPTSAHIDARNSANPPQQISMLPRTFQRIMYFPTAQKIWKFCGPLLVSICRMRLHIIYSEPYTFHEV